MRLILTIAVAALMLSGCMANWQSNKTGPRWAADPYAGESGDHGQTANMNASSASGQFPPP
jgi:hypothetical protein